MSFHDFSGKTRRPENLANSELSVEHELGGATLSASLATAYR
ncbi:hypothetical protein [Paraglaciecola sp. L1A13]|nr:hypothetical protein [Paraglaciecola sp. L1A13]